MAITDLHEVFLKRVTCMYAPARSLLPRNEFLARSEKVPKFKKTNSGQVLDTEASLFRWGGVRPPREGRRQLSGVQTRRPLAWRIKITEIFLTGALKLRLGEGEDVQGLYTHQETGLLCVNLTDTR